MVKISVHLWKLIRTATSLFWTSVGTSR